MHVTLGLLPPLFESTADDGPVVLRFASSPGSQNQALDCDKNITFRDELINNCQNPYIENQRNGSCAGYNTGNLPVIPIGPLPGDDCIVTETGDKSGQIRQAIDERFGRNGGPTCKTLNHWPTPGSGDPIPDPLTDPRFVTIFITDESAFGSSGNTIYPVRRFAGFYITAADGLNCPGRRPREPRRPRTCGDTGSRTSYRPTAASPTPPSSARSPTAGSACLCSSSSDAPAAR